MFKLISKNILIILRSKIWFMIILNYGAMNGTALFFIFDSLRPINNLSVI